MVLREGVHNYIQLLIDQISTMSFIDTEIEHLLFLFLSLLFLGFPKTPNMEVQCVTEVGNHL